MNSPPLVLFDGPCHLCQRSVRFILRCEKTPLLKFCSLQSPAGIKKKQEYDVPPETDALVLIQDGEAFTASDAAFRICAYLRFPWRIFYTFRYLPGWMHRPLYHWIARHRYQWFGKDESCPLPAPEQAERFL